MNNDAPERDVQRQTPLWRASIAALIVGLLGYAFFVLIDHESWFHMRIGSGTAQAMSNAAR